MKRLLLTVLLSVSSALLMAQSVIVSGLQNGVWNADTVIVTGDVLVTDSLVIMAGTKVVFCGEYNIGLRGATLKAYGNADDIVVFKPDASTESWGGIKAENSVVELRGCHFLDSKADSIVRDGGAIRLIDSDASIVGCSFSNCWAYHTGGAIYALNSDVELTQCEISDGGCANSEVDVYTYGAGAFFAGSNARIDRTLFHANSCVTGCGGGVCVDSSSIVVTHCIFEDNFATNGGGISCIRADDRPVVIDNVLIDHNKVVHYGGAMHIAQCYDVHIDNVTICDNLCQGGGGGAMQFHLASKAIINNTIIWGNGWEYDSSMGGDQIWLWDIYSAPEFHNCVLQGGIEGIHHSENVTVYNDVIDQDPLFVDSDERNYRLDHSSPCRNSGDSGLANPSIIIDLDGNDRFSGASIDMGAYEFQESQSVANKEEKRLSVIPVITHNRLTHIKVESDAPCEISVFVQNVLGQNLWHKEVAVDEVEIVRIDEPIKSQVLLITVTGCGRSATVKCVQSEL